MKQLFKARKKVIAGIAAMLLVGAVAMSFKDSPIPYGKFIVKHEVPVRKNCYDTVPKKNKDVMTMQDFDKLQFELDKTKMKIEEELNRVDLSGIRKELEKTMKEVDLDRIRKEIELALKRTDLDKMLTDTKASLSRIETEMGNRSVEKAIEDAKREIEKARLEMKKIDHQMLDKELATAKKEIEKAKIEIDKMDLERIKAEAKEGIDEAKAELKLTKEMFNEMEKDGLIDSKKGFTIEYKNKILYINGKKQDEKTTDKYRRYIKGDHFKISIGKE